MSDTEQFDLDAYLERIGWAGGRRADPATLRGVHLAHALSIPFENLDPVSGRAPSLAPADLMAKMVRGRRGGYCYEHNTLLRLALEALGLRVSGLAGRVVLGAETVESRPRTHMMLRVQVPGDPQPYLADVGFGAAGALLAPVPLTVGTEFEGGGRRHRLVHLPHGGPLELWALQAYVREARGFVSQYAFTLEPFAAPDYEVFNWHIGTNPRSPFTQRPYLQRTTPERHLALDGARLVETRADGTVTERKLTEEAEARRVVEEEFGIVVPEGLRLLG
ncbi:N-hydroxyarylamine O-acetyltransferase [Streptomyces griseochromogenes]|uniref:Acetyltransferase n=1 Tax=Streptomyces griseochromogenes TaxID=68214 RepID=A0A1B1B7R6_9ACTN|nr:arylamine N-acetyltransferase [Streptomyces griseochromogenes]ANP54865.1 acetyltransferase [Streptomyces griseochromogenes]MBP2048552.1 N-hydroxyarylamine O-acetyltransferase [Streptomyces griseochromogenes]